MSERPPFDVLRAAFLLIALVVLTELALTLAGISGCMWLILSGRYEIGVCQQATGQAREVFGELMTGILALLLAARSPPPKDPPNLE